MHAHPSDKYPGIVYTPPLIFLKRLAIFSSSNGKLPHSSAYKMTPQLHISTSAPAYNCPDITCREKVCKRESKRASEREKGRERERERERAREREKERVCTRGKETQRV